MRRVIKTITKGQRFFIEDGVTPPWGFGLFERMIQERMGTLIKDGTLLVGRAYEETFFFEVEGDTLVSKEGLIPVKAGTVTKSRMPVSRMHESSCRFPITSEVSAYLKEYGV